MERNKSAAGTHCSRSIDCRPSITRIKEQIQQGMGQASLFQYLTTLKLIIKRKT